MVTAWSNWAGNQRAGQVSLERPRSSEEVAAAVLRSSRAGRRLKVLGHGHSFSGLARPERDAISLERLCRLRRVDATTGRATVEAGMSLRAASLALASAGLAFTNLGDIDVQSVAGALATGTHGTGARFGGLATQVTGFELVCADGSIRWFDADHDAEVWQTARVHLGALGVVTAVEVQAAPLFALDAEEGTLGLEELLERFDELAERSDHFESYWFPHTGRVSTKRNTRVPPEAVAPLSRARAWFEDSFLQNTVFGAAVATGRWVPPAVPLLNRVAAGALGERRYCDLSYEVFTTPRRVRFVEMEYALDRRVAVETIRALADAVESSGLRVAFPVELRVAAADDIPLSTATGRDSAYVAVHVPVGVDHRPYFALAERIFAEAGGRPHWGKLHTADRDVLGRLYPELDRFVALRDRLDPTGVFANAELDRLIGPAPEAAPGPSGSAGPGRSAPGRP